VFIANLITLYWRPQHDTWPSGKKKEEKELSTTLDAVQNNYTVTSQSKIEQQNYDRNRDNGKHVKRQGEKQDQTGKIGHFHIHR
jgi:hypothetical protein